MTKISLDELIHVDWNQYFSPVDASIAKALARELMHDAVDHEGCLPDKLLEVSCHYPENVIFYVLWKATGKKVLSIKREFGKLTVVTLE